MVKAIIMIATCALAGSMMAQPNNNNVNNSNLSNLFVINNNVNVNVQQSLNVNKPKPNTASQTRRRTASVTTPKPSNVNTQVTVRRATRIRRPSTPTNTASANVAQIQVTPVQVTNENAINVQEFVENVAPQEQVLFTNFNPVQTNEQNLNEENENDNQGVSINLPTFKKPQIYFSYADLSVTHKSFSLKREISKKAIKLSRKHKAKRGGKIRRYITNNCCKWN